MIPAKPDESQVTILECSLTWNQYKQPNQKPKDPAGELPTLPNELQPEGKGAARFGISSYVFPHLILRLILFFRFTMESTAKATDLL